MIDPKDFTSGLFAAYPHEKAKDFVITRLTFKPSQFMEWLQQHLEKEYLNVDVRVSTKDPSKLFCAVNNYKAKDQDPLAPAREALAPQTHDDVLPADVINLEDIPY